MEWVSQLPNRRLQIKRFWRKIRGPHVWGAYRQLSRIKRHKSSRWSANEMLMAYHPPLKLTISQRNKDRVAKTWTAFTEQWMEEVTVSISSCWKGERCFGWSKWWDGGGQTISALWSLLRRKRSSHSNNKRWRICDRSRILGPIQHHLWGLRSMLCKVENERFDSSICRRQKTNRKIAPRSDGIPKQSIGVVDMQKRSNRIGEECLRSNITPFTSLSYDQRNRVLSWSDDYIYCNSESKQIHLGRMEEQLSDSHVQLGILQEQI